MGLNFSHQYNVYFTHIFPKYPARPTVVADDLTPIKRQAINIYHVESTIALVWN